MIVPKAGKNNFWIFFLLCHHFTFWDVCAIYLVVMGTKAGEINFKYFFHTMLNRKKLPPETRSCQKVRKSIFEYCFNSMLLRNKMPPKQRSCQKLKNSIFECFPNWILNRKKLPPEPRSFQKVKKSIFEYFSTSILIYIYININTFFLLIWSVQQKDQEKCLCHLFCEKRMWNFTCWDVCAIYLVVMGTRAREINFEYFFN